MTDGPATMVGPPDSLFVKYIRPGLRNTSTKMMSANRSPFRPSALGATIYFALRSCSVNIYQQTLLVSSWMQSKNMWKSSWLGQISILSLGALICFSVMYCYATLGQKRRRSTSNYGLVGDLNGEKLYEQDSDEFDYEDDSDEDSSRHSSLGQPIRRFLNFRKSSRLGNPTRSAGIVRITSSDPRSNLSSVPIQLDMDSKTSLAPTEASQDPSVVNIMQRSASVARRRRESGRLLGNVNTASLPSRTASPLGRSSPSRKAGSFNQSASPSRPQRAPRSQLSKSGHDSMSDTDIEQKRSSQDIMKSSSSSQTFTSAGVEFEEEEIVSMIPPSILVRQPQVYARKTKLGSDNSSHDMYSLNRNVSGSALWQESPVESSSDFSYNVHLPPPTGFATRRLPPGAGHSPSSPLQTPIHKLGSMDPAQIQAYWLERKNKSIRLKEPDWTPFVDVHIRAKERLETAAHVAANPQPTRMLSPPPLRALSPRLLGDSSPVDGSEVGSHQSGQPQSDQEEEFWFERFTQSTAAAGRDWDWRKRRRQRQMVAAARADEEALRRINGSTDSDVVSVGNVGMTDVQLQKQRNEHARKTNQYINSDEKKQPPLLSVSTNDSILPPRSNRQVILASSPNRKQTASPFGKRLKRYASPMSESVTDSPNEGENEAVETLQYRRSLQKKATNLPVRKLSRRQSELDSDDADVSVPNRLSSLTPKMMRRGLGAKRERDADLTRQLLAEAEEAATDEEDEDGEKARKETEMTASSPQGALGVRKNSSSSGLGFSNQEAIVEVGSVGPIEDAWGAEAGAWSSADAYGGGPPATPASSRVSIHNGTSLPSPSSPTRMNTPRNTSEYLLNGGEELRRQGSKAESQSSNSSTSPLPVFATARSGSRKGILSSASKAASPDRRVSEGGSSIRSSESYSPLYNNSLPLAMSTQ